MEEASGGCREAHEVLGQVQLSSIVPSSVVVLIAVGNVGRWDGKLSVDLVEGRLGGGEAELALEKGRLGGIAVGAGEIEPLGGIDELLGFLDDIGQVGKHGFGQQRMTGRGGRGCGRSKGGEGGDRI